MEFFKKKTNISFLSIKKQTFTFSCLMIILSVLSLVNYGLKLSLDFTGGTQVELHLPQKTSPQDAKDKLRGLFQQANITTIDSARHLMLRVPGYASTDHGNIQDLISQKLPQVQISQVVSVGPQIGTDLFLNGVNALLFALLATMLYIALRFERTFAYSAMIALLHDPIITLGIFSFTQTEFDAVSLAGLLTVLGYSLNDTVVVYDRIRENFLLTPNKDTEAIVNNAINETLSRTIITSGLTLMAVVTLGLFGGDTLWGFALALIIGIVVGTYSSIYVAGSCAVVLGLKLDQEAESNAAAVIQLQQHS